MTAADLIHDSRVMKRMRKAPPMRLKKLLPLLLWRRKMMDLATAFGVKGSVVVDLYPRLTKR